MGEHGGKENSLEMLQSTPLLSFPFLHTSSFQIQHMNEEKNIALCMLASDTGVIGTEATAKEEGAFTHKISLQLCSVLQHLGVYLCKFFPNRTYCPSWGVIFMKQKQISGKKSSDHRSLIASSLALSESERISFRRAKKKAFFVHLWCVDNS